MVHLLGFRVQVKGLKRRAPAAGSLAERLFGYDAKEVEAGGMSHDLENASALSSSLLVCLLVPWVLCFFFYFGEPSVPHFCPLCVTDKPYTLNPKISQQVVTRILSRGIVQDCIAHTPGTGFGETVPL